MGGPSVVSFFLGNYLLALGSIHGVFTQGDNFWEIVVMFVRTFFVEMFKRII